jgi:hypothetical protein
MNHTAVAINWDGKEMTVDFDSSSKDIEKLSVSAHNAFRRNGKWTIELRLVDKTEVPRELRYRA